MNDLLRFISDHEEPFRSPGRLASLYSDFGAHRATNPDGFQANALAWQKALTNAALAGLLSGNDGVRDLLMLQSGEDLVQSLSSPDWGKPLALNSVIQEAVKRKDFVPWNDFMRSKTSFYNRSWIPDPRQLISWTFNQVGIGDDAYENKLTSTNFVLVANVEAAANAIITQFSGRTKSHTDFIYSRSTFLCEFSDVLSSSSSLTPRDYEVILTHLSRDRRMLNFSDDMETIKFSSNPGPISMITEQDVTIAHLKTLIADLQGQLPLLTTKLEDLNSAAKEAVQCKASSLALSRIKSKKLIMQTLERRSSIIVQLEGILSSIDAAFDQVDLVSVMEKSTKALQIINKEVGGVERVERIADRFREETDEIGQINQVISEFGEDMISVDQDAINEELEDLERAEKIQIEKREAQFCLEVEKMQQKFADSTIDGDWQDTSSRQTKLGQDEESISLT